MKSIANIFLILILPFVGLAQSSQYLDSLKQELKKTSNDTIKMDIYRNMGFYLQNGKVDSALYFHQQQLAYAKKLNMKLYEADAHEQIAYVLLWQLDLSEALKNYQTGLKIASDPNSAAISWGYQKFSYSKSPSDARLSIIGMIHYELSTLYQVSRMFEEQKREIAEALKIGTRLNNVKILLLATRDLGFLFAQKNQPDSALKYYKKALSYFDNYAYQLGIGTNYDNMAQVYITKQQYDSAKVYLRKAEKAVFISNDLITLCSSYLNFGRIYQKTNRLDSAIIYGFKTISLAKSIKSAQNVANGYTQLSHTYQLLNQPALALEYLQKGKYINDSINNAYTYKLILLQNAGFEEQMRLKKIADDQAAFQNKLKTIGLFFVITIFLIIALILYRNNKQKQKANKVLEQTLTNLNATQSQLIQSEKMASLGELTAGIAHEIQNPLNFVNNFSEVSAELVKEMVEEVDKGNTEEVKAIANDVVQNLEKINHHGQRAADIVKGMLQHSRSSSGVKEPTDINALADEYLRLAYHGLRAKDKDFNATMKTDFDESVGNVNIVPQDIGRVILNLITNAFYVVHEKSKQNITGYEPTVTISTSSIQPPFGGRSVQIKVSDNGGGIPPKILDKIFQPFFTTKPTGQGTGLGLSLSYDIVKAHGGELKVETTEGEGTIFIISLPVNN